MKLSFVTLFLAADAGAAARKENNALIAAQRKAANAVLAQIAEQKAEAKALAKEEPKDAVGGVAVGGIQARSGALFEDDVSEGNEFYSFYKFNKNLKIFENNKDFFDET
jgi:hypothetical protein